MHTQFDYKKRIVSLENLKAMCNHISGVCHRYQVTKVTPSRVHVTYSNPDEFGINHPMTAVYPCYPTNFDKDNPAVVMEIVRVNNDPYDGEGWQDFDCLLDCPPLWRHPVSGKWVTRQ